MRVRAEEVVARYATNEWLAVYSIASYLSGRIQKIDSVPAQLTLWCDAAKEDGDTEQLEKMLDCGYPRLELKSAKAILFHLEKIDKGMAESSFEDLLAICLNCWAKGCNFPSTPELSKEAREFAKDLWKCRKKRTGLFDVPGAVAFIEKYFKIKSKKADIVPFKLNYVQRKYSVFLEEVMIKENWDNIRIYILKARRHGFSSLILAIDFVYQLCHPFKDKSIIAHKKSESDEKGALTEFWNILQLFYKSLPYAPRKDGEGGVASGLKFDRDGLGSSTSFLSAGAREIARGTNNNILHLSEFAFYMANLWARTRNAVMASAKGALFLAQYETTANALNHAFDLWNKAPALGIYRFFAPWFWLPDYRKVPPQEWNCPEDVKKYFADRPWIINHFKELRFSWNQRQVVMASLEYWVFLTVAQDFEGEWSSFYQEFPSSPEEAFQGSGRHYFRPDTIQKIGPGVKAPIFSGDLHFDPEMVNRDLDKEPPRSKDVKLFADKLGPFKIFKYPEEGHEYVLGGDACSGESVQVDPDLGAIMVRDRWTGEFVAEWVGAVRPEELAWKLIALAIYYQSPRGSIINWETNSYGQTMTSILDENRKLCGYRLYRRRTTDRKTKKLVEKLGFYTSVGSRVIILLSSLRDDIEGNVDNSKWRILNKGLLYEMSTLVRAKNGKWEAEMGRHDDRIFAAALAVVADREARQIATVTEIKPNRNLAKLPVESDTIEPGYNKAIKMAARKKRGSTSGRLPKIGGISAWK